MTRESVLLAKCGESEIRDYGHRTDTVLRVYRFARDVTPSDMEELARQVAAFMGGGDAEFVEFMLSEIRRMKEQLDTQEEAA